MAANDAAASRRRGRYNWDGRYIGKPEAGSDSPSLARRVLLPVGALALLAGVALGVFYFMHSFAADPGVAPVAAAKPQPALATAAGTAVPAVAGTQKAEAAPSEDTKQAAAAQDVAGRVVSPGKLETVQANAPVAQAVAVANVKVPAPGNARWGEAADGKPDAAPAAQANAPQANASQAQAAADTAEAAPDVKDPQSAPVPTETPKKLAYASSEPKPAHPVDKAVTTASLPPARATKDATPPGVDPNLLSIPAKASVDAPVANVAPGGGYVSTVKAGVRMRSGAGNHTGTIGVIPDNATVHVLECKAWCKVSYNGKLGYIYKSFLGGSAAAVAKPAPALAQAAAAPAQEPQKKTAAAAAATSSTSALEAAGQQNLATRAK